MVLGAGPAQAPGISNAVASGLHVITVDPHPDNIGHAYSHEYVNCDTRDQSCVLEAAVKLRIDGICTFRSDVAVSTVHHVREHMRLPGAYPLSARTMSDKGRFREFQRASNLPCPNFVCGQDFDGLYQSAKQLEPPLFCKPVDNCGSRGISRIEAASRAELRSAIGNAMENSRSGAVCLEERAPGIEVGGDAIMEGGEIVFIAVTQKFVVGHVVTGHRLPCNLQAHDQQRVKEAIEVTCRALGYREGPVNFDAMVSPQAVTMLEMSPRNGGNGIADLIRHAHGVDVETITVDLALSRQREPTRPEFFRGHGVALLGSIRAGHIVRLPSLNELNRQCPAVVDVFYSKRVGNAVEPFVHNANAIGYVTFRCDDPDEYSRNARAILPSFQDTVGDGHSHALTCGDPNIFMGCKC